MIEKRNSPKIIRQFSLFSARNVKYEALPWLQVVDLLLFFLLPLVSITVNKSTLLDKCIRFVRTTAVKTVDRSKSLSCQFFCYFTKNLSGLSIFTRLTAHCNH